MEAPGQIILRSPPAGERIDGMTLQSCYWGVFYGFWLAPHSGVSIGLYQLGDWSSEGGRRASMAPSAIRVGNTSLQWSADGSLSQYDYQALMQRLCAVDPELGQTETCNDRIDGQLRAEKSD